MRHPARDRAEPEPEPRLEELLTGVAQGNTALFDGVYDQLARSVFGLVRAVLRNRALAEEVTQDVFIEVWRTAPRYCAAQGTVQTWVMTLAHRRAIDCVRAEDARSRRERAAMWECSRDRPFDQVAETAVDNADRHHVQRCLRELTLIQRQSVWLAYYDGKTINEIADELAASPNTVKTRLRDGLKRMRGTMLEHGPPRPRSRPAPTQPR